MTRPPTGTVTMLFSDTEGSTVLLSRLGDRYAVALDGQRSILRDAWSRSGGYEIGTEGDSFFVVFERARDAAAAATDAQRSDRTLSATPWGQQRGRGVERRGRLGRHKRR